MSNRTYTYLTAVIGVVCGYVIVRSILSADSLTVRNDLVQGVFVGAGLGVVAVEILSRIKATKINGWITIERQHFVANPIDRYSVGDRSGLAQNADGSVDIYLQNAAPAGHQANWLPAPAGRFNLWLRVYMPGAAILRGEYAVPPVVEAGPSR